MDIRIEESTADWAIRPISQRLDYQPLFAALAAAPDNWISVSAADVAGKDLAAKQTALYQAAKHRQIRITTRTRDGRLYLRLIPK